MGNLDAQKTAVYFMWMVGIVAGVALFVSFLNYSGTGSKDVYGAVVEAPSSSKWISCLDQGNKIKLANNGDSLVKTDTCVGDGITRVSCAEDQYGYFTYEYAAAQSCPNGKSCVENDGIASCQ